MYIHFLLMFRFEPNMNKTFDVDNQIMVVENITIFVLPEWVVVQKCDYLQGNQL